MKTYQTLKVELSKNLVTISLNRPEVRNAFHPTMIAELKEFFDEIPNQKEIRAVVLRGEGKSFCAGADLEYMKSMAAYSMGQNMSDSEDLFEMFWAIRSCPIPLIGVFHGHVMGGAIGLASLCDIGVAVDGVRFCFSEVRLGLSPAIISSFVVEKMQSAQAKRYMLTGEVFDEVAAHGSGLVDFVGTREQAEDFVSDMVECICGNGPEAVRATKTLLRNTCDQSEWSIKRKLTTETIAERRVSPEGQEGLASFFEKRLPSWKSEETQ